MSSRASQYDPEQITLADVADQIVDDPEEDGSDTDPESEPIDGLDRPWQSRDVLEELYWRQGMSQYEIADRLDTRQPLVSETMDRLGVPARHDWERFARRGRMIQLGRDE